jgi:hypothetical protein
MGRIVDDFTHFGTDHLRILFIWIIFNGTKSRNNNFSEIGKHRKNISLLGTLREEMSMLKHMFLWGKRMVVGK